MPLAVVFPGQGSQAVGMGTDLAATYPAAKQIFERADAALGWALSRLIADGPDEKLRDTANAQPALLVTEIAAFAALEAELGEPPPIAVAAGHSVGEYAALVAVGALPFEDALLAVQRRGKLMQQAGAEQPGSMVAILGLDDLEVEDVCRAVSQDVVVGNYNCPGQVVVSGPADAVAAVADQCRARGARRTIPLQVSGAFHSPLMRSAAESFAQVVDELPITAPRSPIVGNVDGALLSDSASIRAELRRQLGAPVRWTASVRTMATAGTDRFVELGPGQVLRGLIGRTIPGASVRSAGDVEAIRATATWIQTESTLRAGDD